MRSVVAGASVIVSIWILTGCSAMAPNDMGTASDVQGSDWALNELVGFNIDTDRRPTLRFKSETQVQGFSGCNSFTGGALVGQNTIEFQDMILTMRSCRNSAMEMESSYIDALGKVTSWEIDIHMLRLKNSDGKTLLRYRRMGSSHFGTT